MTDPKPIETRYAGCRFRSRLEARWAVFFDHLDIRWQYETEGYNLSNGDRYLPDFYLPTLDQWVEVKGKADNRDRARIALAAGELPANPSENLLSPGVLVLGAIPEPVQHSTLVHMRVASIRGLAMYLPSVFLLRSDTKSVGVMPVAGPQVLEVQTLLEASGPATSNINLTHYHRQIPCPPEVLSAYIAARSARFEHGEQG
ncbi:hypothetical protein ACGFIW_01325 [Micromonospora sp. NPDC048935]|uniref:hypothetical protein n=1 Tax=Micromonospora sp. NPDC048935 TaxID=3364262 RepID=UPI003713E98F